MIKLTLKKLPLALVIALTGCGGGGGASNNNSSNVDNNNNTVNSDYYFETPNPETCFAGSIKDTLKLDALNKVNQIRSLHGLSPVEYDYSSDKEMQETALFMVVNRTISHNINANSKCYTDSAKNGSFNSNLSLKSVDRSVDPLSHITDWMTEKDSPDLAHRRWLLNPFLKKVSFGYAEQDVSGRKVVAASLKVIYLDDLKDSRNNTGIIAYPFNRDYPISFFDKDSKLSFSIFDNQTDYWNNKNIDYSDSVVTVKDRNSGAVMKLTDIKFDNRNIGLSNNFEFKVDNLKQNTLYDVHVSNVAVNGVQREYDYHFSLK